MEHRYRKALTQIEKHFVELFTHLFGGGSARLHFDTPDDLVSSGVEIEVQLPGSRRMPLRSLSGGQRSLIFLSLYGTNVAEAYEKLLSSSVAIQLIPFVYLFAGLWKLKTNRIWAACGFVATAIGVILVFVPSSDVTNPLRFFLEVMGSFLLMIGVAVFLYKLAVRKQKRSVA